jgi:hypothetical protein
MSARDELAKVRAELRHEVAYSDAKGGNWQPMVSAREVRTLLDALDDQDRLIAEAKAEAWDEGAHAGRTYQMRLNEWSRCLGTGVAPNSVRNPYRAALESAERETEAGA